MCVRVCVCVRVRVRGCVRARARVRVLVRAHAPPHSYGQLSTFRLTSPWFFVQCLGAKVNFALVFVALSETHLKTLISKNLSKACFAPKPHHTRGALCVRYGLKQRLPMW